MNRLARIALLVVVLCPAVAEARGPGKIVVANDEWTLSQTGFNAPSDSAIYARNVAEWFTGGEPGAFLVYSSNFGLVGAGLQSTMVDAGHTWTISTSAAFTVSNLLNYDAVFVGGLVSGAVPNNQVLIDYVAAGGCVYLCGGTGFSNEGNAWNTFLNAHGLSFANVYNSISGQRPISSAHPVMEGVDTLYQNSGNSITDLDLLSDANLVIATHSNGAGLYAVYSPPECIGDFNNDGAARVVVEEALIGRRGAGGRLAVAGTWAAQRSI